MDGLLVYRLAFNNNVVCFKLLREHGVVATACNKVGLIPPSMRRVKPDILFQYLKKYN